MRYCETCDGAGEVKCSCCDGTGKIPRWMQDECTNEDVEFVVLQRRDRNEVLTRDEMARLEVLKAKDQVWKATRDETLVTCDECLGATKFECPEC